MPKIPNPVRLFSKLFTPRRNQPKKFNKLCIDLLTGDLRAKYNFWFIGHGFAIAKGLHYKFTRKPGGNFRAGSTRKSSRMRVSYVIGLSEFQLIPCTIVDHTEIWPLMMQSRKWMNLFFWCDAWLGNSVRGERPACLRIELVPCSDNWTKSAEGVSPVLAYGSW